MIAGIIAILLVAWGIFSLGRPSTENASAESANSSSANDDSTNHENHSASASSEKSQGTQSAGASSSAAKKSEDSSAKDAHGSDAKLEAGSDQRAALDQGLSALDTAASQAKSTEDKNTEGEHPAAAEDPAQEAKDSSADVAGLSQHFADQALEESAISVNELQANGWHTEGKTKVVGTPAVTEKGSGAKKTLEAQVCVDSSDVRTVDSEGKTVETSKPAKVKYLYTLAQRDGQWKIVSTGYPADPTC